MSIMKLNIWKKNRFTIIFALFFIFIIYTLFFLWSNKNIFIKTDFAYYNYLVDSFFHFRLNILPMKETLDLSKFKNQWYLYWGPAPILFILPFYFMNGINANDIIYTFVAGIINVYLFYLISKEFIKYFKLKIPIRNRLIILLSFAFISPNFYLSLKGAIWSTNQVISVLYLLLFYLFYFKYLNKINSKTSYKYILLSAIFYNLTWLSRFTLIFNGLLFFIPFFLLFKRKKKALLKRFCLFCGGITLVFIAIFFIYNYARFNNFLETGMKYQKGVWRYDGYFQQGKIFSKTFIPHNFRYYFLNFLLPSLKKPYINSNPEGNSIFSVYPTLLFLIWLLKINFSENKKIKLLLLISVIIITMNMGVLLVNVGTGWVQFGARYFFDMMPLLYLFLFFVINRIPLWLKTVILSYGAIVNLLGVLVFNGVIK